MGRGPEKTFFQRKYIDDQQICEKVVNITSHQGKINLNHHEPLHHICRMALAKRQGIASDGKHVKKKNPNTLLVG
jgi:hypothetical protein